MALIETQARWAGFAVSGPAGDRIPLQQIGAKQFLLGEVTITYVGRTGLEKFVARGDLDPDVHEEIRTITNELLPETDLASVPGPLRWFTNTYGSYTPAALIHDYLIPAAGAEPKIPEEYADRYFRHMLGAVGVPRFKSFIMWTAVAIRTRLKSHKRWRPVLLAVWALTSLLGLLTFFAAGVDLLLGDGELLGVGAARLVAASLVAPFACSLLWGRQYAAGIVTAVAAPLLLPGAILAWAGYTAYVGVEGLSDGFDRLVAVLRQTRPASESSRTSAARNVAPAVSSKS